MGLGGIQEKDERVSHRGPTKAWPPIGGGFLQLVERLGGRRTVFCKGVPLLRVVWKEETGGVGVGGGGLVDEIIQQRGLGFHLGATKSTSSKGGKGGADS